jgi:hypothetical protein
MRISVKPEKFSARMSGPGVLQTASDWLEQNNQLDAKDEFLLGNLPLKNSRRSGSHT